MKRSYAPAPTEKLIAGTCFGETSRFGATR